MSLRSLAHVACETCVDLVTERGARRARADGAGARAKETALADHVRDHHMEWRKERDMGKKDDGWDPDENREQVTDPGAQVSQIGSVYSSMADDEEREGK
ncbi:hypothetical protein ABZ419_08890 [Streptomyces cinnamoneus]|uniref:hypothetical protein n=1 Tax=Streptomyces cinnamoneus TaxID=53446 RepID=UPI0033E9AD19